jgi:hypothetical protein
VEVCVLLQSDEDDDVPVKVLLEDRVDGEKAAI